MEDYERKYNELLKKYNDLKQEYKSFRNETTCKECGDTVGTSQYAGQDEHHMNLDCGHLLCGRCKDNDTYIRLSSGTSVCSKCSQKTCFVCEKISNVQECDVCDKPMCESCKTQITCDLCSSGPMGCSYCLKKEIVQGFNTKLKPTIGFNMNFKPTKGFNTNFKPTTKECIKCKVQFCLCDCESVNYTSEYDNIDCHCIHCKNTNYDTCEGCLELQESNDM